ncbi:DUF4396 domain-containing protein [Gordonia sp. NPDC003429]
MRTLHNADIPSWLVTISWISVALAVCCAVLVTIDIVRRPQPMPVMNLVWPIVTLFGSVAWAAAYLWWSRAQPRTATADDKPDESMDDMDMGNGDTGNGDSMPGMTMTPALGLSGKEHSMRVSTFVGTCHCGAGCSLADLIVEWAVFAVPVVAVLGGWHWLFADSIYAEWVLAYIVAYIIGIAFQYFSIAPMRGLGVADGLKAAIKADTLSITSWQVGMYATMAVVQLAIMPAWLDGRLAVNTPVFWAMMQIAMVVGFATAYPVNWWLIGTGIKERM